MKLKHTQGDWRIRKTVDESGDYPFPTYDILAVYEWGPECVACAFQNPHNARLIAAAPEMLEALIEAYIHNNHWGSANYHRFSEDLEFKMKNIIEKATGMSIEEVLNGNNNNN